MDQNNRPDEGRRISLMIIGAQKAGTTSMKNYLGQHPYLETHPHKEYAYFFSPDQYQDDFKNAQKKYFNASASSRLLVAKNAGLYVNESGIKRLKEHNEDCKLILILRNPVERTYSSYLMEKNYGAIEDPFESIEVVLKEKNIKDWRYEFLIGMGLYHQHLKMIYNYFSRENLKIIRYEDFEKNGEDVCKDIFKWMGIDDSFVVDTSIKFNETTVSRSHRYGKFIVRMLQNQNPVKNIFRKILPGKIDYKIGEMLRDINKKKKTYEPASEKMTNLLHEFFEPHNNELSKLTGIDFSDWNKEQ